MKKDLVVETPKALEQRGEQTGHTSGRELKINDEYWKYFTFLDNLRESGVTNMFGARPYLVEEFGLDETTAGKILSYWMQSFGKSNR